MTNRKEFTLEEAKSVGDSLCVSWENFDVDQLRRGMNIELEHGTQNVMTNVTDDDATITAKIALAHLEEISDYYDRLEKMETEAEMENPS